MKNEVEKLLLNQSEVTLNVVSGRVIGFPVPGSDAPTALTFIPGDVLYVNEIIDLKYLLIHF